MADQRNESHQLFSECAVATGFAAVGRPLASPFLLEELSKSAAPVELKRISRSLAS